MNNLFIAAHSAAIYVVRGGVRVPDEIRPEVWEAFEEMRKKIRKPMTVYAKKLIIKKLLSMDDDPNDILEQSIMNSWQGLWPLKNGTMGAEPMAAPAKKSRAFCTVIGCDKLGIIGQGETMYCRKHDPEAMR